MAKYTLVYFPVHGRAMHIRYLFIDNDLSFEDKVVTGEQWPAIKPTTVFGQIPMLKDGDFEICQSNSILRHLARKHKLYGKDEKEQTLIDMVNDQQEDIRVGYVRLIYQEYDAEKDNYIKKLPSVLAPLESFLSKNHGGAGFFVGDSISFADYTVFDILDNLLVLSPTCLGTFPKLKGFHDRMAARPKIAAYRQTDAFKKLPINGNGKQ